MEAALRKNHIAISTGAQISFYYEKPSLKRRFKQDVEIVKNGANKFLALFEHEDVDFTICVRNPVEARGLGFTIKTVGKKGDFYVAPGAEGNLNTMESRGGKFHFVSQDSDAGKQVVGMAAKKLKTSHYDASVKISRMEFTFEVEKIKEKKPIHPPVLKGKVITIFVKMLTDHILEKKIGHYNTIDDLKMLIHIKEGIAMDQQRLMLGNPLRLLEDRKTFNDYDIQDKTTIHLVLRLRGGACPPVCLKKSAEIENAETLTDNLTRGAVCFGEKSDQTFNNYKGFEADESMVIPPIVIEFHKKTKLSI